MLRRRVEGKFVRNDWGPGQQQHCKQRPDPERSAITTNEVGQRLPGDHERRVVERQTSEARRSHGGNDDRAI